MQKPAVADVDECHDDEDSEANESKDMMFREDDGYKEFFKKAMKKFGVTVHHRKSFKPVYNILLANKKQAQFN